MAFVSPMKENTYRVMRIFTHYPPGIICTNCTCLQKACLLDNVSSNLHTAYRKYRRHTSTMKTDR
jgi:hypothetical protein